VQRKASAQSDPRRIAPHLQTALGGRIQSKPARAKILAVPVIQRSAEKKDDQPKADPPKQKILDLRPKRFNDQHPMSNYEASIASIKNAAAYGVDKAPLVYVTSGWHEQNPGTPIAKWHFDISLDGSTQLHVYWDPKEESVSIA